MRDDPSRKQAHERGQGRLGREPAGLTRAARCTPLGGAFPHLSESVSRRRTTLPVRSRTRGVGGLRWEDPWGRAAGTDWLHHFTGTGRVSDVVTLKGQSLRDGSSATPCHMDADGFARPKRIFPSLRHFSGSAGALVRLRAGHSVRAALRPCPARRPAVKRAGAGGRWDPLG